MHLSKEDYFAHAPSGVGDKVRVNHDSSLCSGESRSMVVERRADGVYARCYRCGAWGSTKDRAHRGGFKAPKKGVVALPKDTELDTTKWPPQARVWYRTHSIASAEIEEARIGYSPYLGRIIIPAWDGGKLMGYQARKIHAHDPGPKYYTSTDKEKKKRMMFHCGYGDIAVVCEDALSAIKLGRHALGVAALGTDPSDHIIAWLACQPLRKVIVFLDYDNAIVKKKARDLQRKLSLLFPDVGLIGLNKDPKELDDKELSSICS